MTDLNALLLTVILAANAGDLDGKESLNKAYFKYSGLESTLQTWERNELPQEVRLYGGNVLLVTKVLVDKHIIIRWTFP